MSSRNITQLHKLKLSFCDFGGNHKTFLKFIYQEVAEDFVSFLNLMSFTIS